MCSEKGLFWRRDCFSEAKYRSYLTIWFDSKMCSEKGCACSWWVYIGNIGWCQICIACWNQNEAVEHLSWFQNVQCIHGSQPKNRVGKRRKVSSASLLPECGNGIHIQAKSCECEHAIECLLTQFSFLFYLFIWCMSLAEDRHGLQIDFDKWCVWLESSPRRSS